MRDDDEVRSFGTLASVAIITLVVAGLSAAFEFLVWLVRHA
jgi:nitrate reductase NapE component